VNEEGPVHTKATKVTPRPRSSIFKISFGFAVKDLDGGTIFNLKFSI
jgi:hypothetical protein